jgi:16S rRNA (guanine527-N7)-methyltransferase
MDGFELLQEEFFALIGQKLEPHQLKAAHRYADLLSEWNQKINLTAIKTPEEIRRKHFLDSFSCMLVTKGTPTHQMIDIGTGAGFPGLPLKILHPEMHLTLVESVAKKTNFLSLVVQELGLKPVEIITERAEIVGQDPDHRERYDWAVARAVAGLPILVEYLLPLARVGGFVLAQKGDTALEEIKAAQPAIAALGGKAREPIPVALPGVPEKRFLVVIEKTHPTPAQYPRRVGIPSKRPLS